MRIGLLTTSLSREGGGVFEAVAAQAHLLRDLGHDPVLFGFDQQHSRDDAAKLPDCEIHYVALQGPLSVGLSAGMGRALHRAMPDMLHMHGIWTFLGLPASRWARRHSRPFAISPHGMMDPWITARSPLKKALAYRAWERAAWRQATLFHALTQDEAADIARHVARAGSPASVETVPNAAPVPCAETLPYDRRGGFAYLGRIHEKKNVHALIAAYLEGFPASGPGLRIAGWGDEADVARLRKRIGEIARSDIAFLGPQFGAEKARLLGEARFLVLPSHSEGLPMTILESWAAGTPTLQSAACHLPEGFGSGAAMDCGSGTGAIAAALRKAGEMGAAEWDAMSQAATKLADGPFSGPQVALRWQAFYEKLAGRG